MVLNVDTGCTAPSSATVLLIDSTNPDPSTNETEKIYPCFDHPTLTDLLNANKISCHPAYVCAKRAPPNGTACTGSDWSNNVVLNYTQVLTDIASGQLAGMSWVIPSGGPSDHAGITDGSGPSWVASVVNAIGNNPYWANTTIIIARDD